MKGMFISMQRKHELFEQNNLKHNEVVVSAPKKLYPQETDWTCSVACIRTMLSGITYNVPEEMEIVRQNNMKPGPYYSRDIKKLGLLDNYDVVYGCDKEKADMDMVLDMVQNGYYVMLECMYNYAHWMVLLGYYPLENSDIEKSELLMYDPYYDKIRLLSADEFISMWIDGNYENTKVIRDFIAVK